MYINYFEIYWFSQLYWLEKTPKKVEKNTLKKQPKVVSQGL
jgi:hypothetical protein